MEVIETIELAERIQQEAKAAVMSVSRYLANLVKREIVTDWPEGYFEEVVGGWRGLGGLLVCHWKIGKLHNDCFCVQNINQQFTLRSPTPPIGLLTHSAVPPPV
jgi:hypothetical protein